MDIDGIERGPSSAAWSMKEIATADLPYARIRVVDWAWSTPMDVTFPRQDFCYLSLLLEEGAPCRAQYLGVDVGKTLGKVCFFPSGLPLRGLYSPTRKRVVSCLIDAQHFAAAGGAQIEWNAAQLAESLDISNPRIDSALNRIASELCKPAFASKVIVEGLMCVVLGELLQHFHQISRDFSANGGLTAWRMRIIKEHVNGTKQPPIIDELARLCRVTPRHLMRAFKSQTGETIGAYISRTQMERAKTLLNSGLAVGNVAKVVGFSRASSFSFAFKRATGMSPNEFRRAC
jgi:AraC family transcriptional regulator